MAPGIPVRKQNRGKSSDIDRGWSCKVGNDSLYFLLSFPFKGGQEV
jgi:hypothetical protein